MSSLLADTNTPGRSSETKSPIIHSIRSSSLKNSPTSLRSKSLSPRKRTANQPLHIRMNLTETQMDKITDAFMHKLNSSQQNSVKSTRKLSDRSADLAPSDHGNSNSIAKLPESYNRHDAISVVSPTFSELMPGAKDNSIAERRQKIPPAQINVSGQNRIGTRPQRSHMEHIDAAVSPLTTNGSNFNGITDGPTSSSYSTDAIKLHSPRPLNLPNSRRSQRLQPGKDAVIDIYNDWTQFYSSGVSPLSPDAVQFPSRDAHHPRRSKSLAEGIRRQGSPGKASCIAETVHQANYPPETVSESPLFSPLPLYFRGQDFPAVKRGGKTLIGNNGWLEKTGQDSLWLDADGKAAHKKARIIDSIKKIAKDMTELHYPHRRLPNAKASGAHLSISLDAREQSLLYCELEYHLTGALNSYISRELENGRLVPLNFKKITDAWYQQGRPRVVGFRFDLETQIDLVALHVGEFTFCGRRQCNPVEISSLLQTMKVNARAMRIRTFCQPDSVIAKQLVDSQSLFGMIGVPDESNQALAEIVHFFKVIVEREHKVQQQRQKEQRHTIKLPAHGNQ